MMDLLPRLRARIRDEADDNLLLEMLTDAKGLVLGHLNRQELPEACENAVLRTAVALYNRMGMEGESSHSEGGVSFNPESIPGDVKEMLRPYRLMGTVR
jgi:hypothetical protein